MTSLKLVNRRVGSLFAVAALVLATITPGLVPAFASAAQVTERSVELSSASKAATGVEYNIKFTTVSAAGAVLLDFCSDSPLIGDTCTAPTGFSVSSATVAGTPALTKGTGTANDANTVFATGTLAATDEVTVTLTGVTNPTNSGPLYVRIVTFSGAEAADDAAAYVSDAATPSTYADAGGAAASITDSVGVSASVLESMTFCVAGEAITGVNCEKADAEPLLPPTVKLGQGVGTIRALSASALSEGSIFSQISTNAVNGAAVYLRSSVECGGLKRLAAAAGVCDIAPASGAGGIAAGDAKFGVRVVANADPTNAGVGGVVGKYQIYGADTTPYYSDSIFKLNYVEGNATGVSSTYGDALLDTGGAPVNNKNVEIIFGASVANNTPAGTYSTDLSLIATGKF